MLAVIVTTKNAECEIQGLCCCICRLCLIDSPSGVLQPWRQPTPLGNKCRQNPWWGANTHVSLVESPSYVDQGGGFFLRESAVRKFINGALTLKVVFCMVVVFGVGLKLRCSG